MYFYKFLPCLLTVLFSVSVVLAQKSLPITEKVVFINVNNATAEEVLQKITTQTGVQFSYNPQILMGLPLITLSVQYITIRELLYKIFPQHIKTKTRGNYIILQKQTIAQQAENRPAKILINGYVIDKNTQQKLTNVSVYEKNSLTATLTNVYGYFQIQLESTQTEVFLSFAKEKYIPQTLSLPTHHVPFLTVSLEPQIQLDILPSYKIKTLPSIDSFQIARVLIPNRQAVHARNLKESFLRKVQISLLPVVGTNHVLSGHVSNQVSFNALIGYNGGVGKFEIGGLANINRGRVQGVQVGGLFNAVAGEVHGVQISGLLNLVRDSVQGVQISGLLNVNGKEVNGVQLGSLLNVNMQGIKGVQVGGLVNFNLKQTIGVQTASLMNVALGRMEGVQIAGILNIAGKVKKGWQIGLFNYADSAHHLKQIGLVNFVRKGGYKNIELGTDEQLSINFTVRSGTPYFYTLARVGIRPYPARPFWHYGYGFGCRVAQWRTWESNTELFAYQLLRTLGRQVDTLTGNVTYPRAFENFGARYQLFMSKYIGKHFAITLGLAVDFNFLGVKSLDYEKARTLLPFIMYNTYFSNKEFRIAVGGTVGIRFR